VLSFFFEFLMRCSVLWTLLFCCVSTHAQEPKSASLPLDQFRPQSQLVVPQTLLTRAKFPVIDIHTHFQFKIRNIESVDAYLTTMDRNQIAGCVSLDAVLGPKLPQHLELIRQHPRRLAAFAHLDWQGAGQANDQKTWDYQREDFVHRTVENLREAQRHGVLGIKVFKNLGLELTDAKGALLRIDDPRWDPIWKTCGELQLPILIHVGDPIAFFQPVDAKNERWEELHRHPEWSFHGDNFPSHAEVLKQFLAIVERHPRTQFLGAHLANNAENLGELGAWLDRYTNLHVEIASRINELGRQPYTARKFLIKYQDRVLFGTDGPWPEARLHYYWRFLESYDEYFPYSEKEFPPQGFWRIYGVGLPDDVLKKIYHANAVKLMPGLSKFMPGEINAND
jgi:predicted TIM-barrel fold metal-dependent hydrolase